MNTDGNSTSNNSSSGGNDSTTNDAVFKKLFPKKYFCKCISNKQRMDTRNFDAIRGLDVQVDTISTADSSATITIGTTTVVVGIKVEITEPSINEPSNGFLEVNVNMTPFCGLRHEFGKSSDEALAMAEFTRRTLVESKIFDLQDLCIEEHKSVWTIHVDCVCLSDGGSIIDAVLVGSGMALSRLVLPALVLSPTNQLVRVDKNEISTMFDNDNNETLNGKRSIKSHGKKLPVASIPIPLTFGVFNYNDKKIVLADPCDEEEPMLESTFTVVCFLHRNDLSIYKQGGAGINVEIMNKAFDISKKRYNQIAGLESVQSVQ